MKRNSVRQGFTLVEIMIVVVIIGILLSIAVPVWMNRRQTARLNAVVANLRAIEDGKQRWAGELGKANVDVCTPADLVPGYLHSWPVLPFNRGLDYSAGSVASEPTFKAIPLSRFQDPATQAAAIAAAGF